MKLMLKKKSIKTLSSSTVRVMNDVKTVAVAGGGQTSENIAPIFTSPHKHCQIDSLECIKPSVMAQHCIVPTLK
ncbi:hypothetical protein [Pseudoalteromonas luteoviolacea]|uniref:Uncharacterized protein n=2 Tax=Pseudoalteromonas luteoviolacea TaxID=43657 RepID=A0A167KUJ4_9GAMM|nr:hypothetical protein [Pseudoalteromonas luteoviolacea]AOT10076.1 hypothetical protein S4054249_20655 [Pseudoalteromonas luteoviolacea]AOT14987.1 hypothetical protein S40542_20620 [Pseudoalteromonas luteoviolacea]AOT19904.1 hypothetical protein S4054_20630 [Pseudoalteromonas luteoviolacea]KKE84833.1 hypothetical protein N479_06980 [Pseudoalteromonas luteoviolacea S4054]KZN63294.1 hypothetical protein N473_17855 [Pseudoalteromonas luteoviolacea CPMOR-1]